MRLIAFTLLVGSLIGLIAWVDQPDMKFRWHRTVCTFPSALASSNETVDLVSMGSSRMMRAMDAFAVQSAVQARTGRMLIIYDLAKPYRGPEVDYLLLRTALAARHVKAIMVEYKRGSDAYAQHRHTVMVGQFADIKFLYWDRPGLRWRDRLQLTFRFILRKLSETITMALTGGLREIVTLPSPILGSFDPTPPKDLIAPWDLAEPTGPTSATTPGWDFDAADTLMDTYMVEQVVRMTRNTKTRPVFFHIPRVYDPPLEQSFPSTFKRRFGADLLILPPELLTKIYPSGYADGSHMNEYGAKLVANWLAAQSVLWN